MAESPDVETVTWVMPRQDARDLLRWLRHNRPLGMPDSTFDGLAAALRGAGLPEPRACPTAVIDAWFVAVEWDRLSPDSPILPRYVGPFPSRVDAEAWGLANIRNGSWDILRLAQPFSVIPPEVTEEATP
jgi:hypothetical protein